MTKATALLTSALTGVRELPKLAHQEDLNFLLTNRIPRRLTTQFIGWFSKVRSPLVRDLSIGLWQLFADVDLRDAAKEQFESLHDCFIRELTPGARPVDPAPNVLTSPCDAIVGACGTACVAASATQGAERHPLPHPLHQGSRDGVVRTRLDHHRLRAEGVLSGRGTPHRRGHPHGHAAAAVALTSSPVFSRQRGFGL
jgi:hypothetical protein